MNIPILAQLNQLKQKHATAKVNSAAFQPNEKDQKTLIAMNEKKREEAKRIMEQRLREADAKLQEAERLKNQPGDSVKMVSAPSFSDRAQTAPMLGAASGRTGRAKSFKFSVDESIRPSTAGAAPGDKGFSFDSALKTVKVGEQFGGELKTQVDHQAQDSRRIFDALIQHFKTGGLCCQFSAKRPFEVIDVSSFVSKPLGGSSGTLRLEDLNNSMKKKDGIALFFDPTTDTGGAVVTVRIYFQKAIDLVTSESCSKDYSFWSDGNYFGLQLIDETGFVRWTNRQQQEQQKGGGGRGSNGPSGSNSPQGLLSPAAPSSPTGSPGSAGAIRKGLDAPPPSALKTSDSVSTASSVVARRKRCLPGWQGRPPLFVPSTRCSLEIVSVQGPDGAPVPASTAYNLSRLRIFAVAAVSPRAAIRKLHEFCSGFFVSHTANLTVTGGISALNLAALHGNLEAVKQLVTAGANINARSKESKNHTALHEAVIGGHPEVARYLLQMGANQLLRDETGFSPLHHACQLENISLARVLIEAESGKRALLLHNNSDQKPIELCTSHFMKIRIEGAMRKLKIFVKPRVSILNR